MKRKLGSNQQGVLDALVEHGEWYQNSGWVWRSQLNTVVILRRLVALGLVSVVVEPRGTISGTNRPCNVYRPVAKRIPPKPAADGTLTIAQAKRQFDIWYREAKKAGYKRAFVQVHVNSKPISTGVEVGGIIQKFPGPETLTLRLVAHK